jgi:DNA-directed RNA polymerase subunit beta'
LSDYWIASYGARKGMMDRALATKDPGVFNKRLMATTMNNVISMEDCGTKQGIKMSVTSPDILGRFLQGNQARVSDETIINEDVVKRFKAAKLREVLVRSPLKCKAPKGTCRHCYGVDENGSLVSIGDNIGAKAGQTIAEPLTQMTMNTFHTGGVAGTGKKGGAARINELLDMPAKMKVGKSILASVSGKIEKIEPSGLGGFNVYIKGKKHVTSPNLKLLVKVGQEVKKGDQLNQGAIAPQELLEYKGMDTVQNYLTDELKSAYKGEGIDIDRKTFETIIRSVADRTLVVNNAKGNPWLPGESIPYSVAMEYNKNLKEGQEELIHEPYLKGVNWIPQTRQDWLAQMGATHIKDAIVQGASQGWMSDVKDYHPIPAFAYGASFGEGDEGKY